jgi:hypothetical protein
MVADVNKSGDLFLQLFSLNFLAKKHFPFVFSPLKYFLSQSLVPIFNLTRTFNFFNDFFIHD